MKRVAALLVAGLLTQTATAAEMVIGTVDLQQLSPYISQMQSQAMKGEGSLKSDYAAMQQHINEFKKKAATDQSKMTAAQKKALADELNTMKQNVSKESMEMSGRMIKAQGDVMRQVQDKIMGMVAEIAKAQHVNTVMPKQVLLYSEGAVDLTPALLKKLGPAPTTASK